MTSYAASRARRRSAEPARRRRPRRTPRCCRACWRDVRVDHLRDAALPPRRAVERRLRLPADHLRADHPDRRMRPLDGRVGQHEVGRAAPGSAGPRTRTAGRASARRRSPATRRASRARALRPSSASNASQPSCSAPSPAPRIARPPLSRSTVPTRDARSHGFHRGHRREQGAEPDPLGHHRRRAQRHPGVDAEHRLPGEDAVPADLLAERGQLGELTGVSERHHEPESHAARRIAPADETDLIALVAGRLSARRC